MADIPNAGPIDNLRPWQIDMLTLSAWIIYQVECLDDDADMDLFVAEILSTALAGLELIARKHKGHAA